MNRETLFRGRTLTTWIYGYLYIDEKETCHIRDNNIGDVFVNKTTIGQYTGLCDKEGNKIFEGDVVKCKLVDIVKEGRKWMEKYSYEIYLCEWSKRDHGFQFYSKEAKTKNLLGTTLVDCELEIVGNIHDNPNLIKEEGE